MQCRATNLLSVGGRGERGGGGEGESNGASAGNALCTVQIPEIPDGLGHHEKPKPVAVIWR